MTSSAHIALLSVVAVSILLMLIRPRGISEVYWVGGGVLTLLAARLMPLRLAATAAVQGIDVYLFLIGMMLLSELAKVHGVFDWLSSAAVHRARGSCARLFTMVYGIGALVTILMSNDATAVVLTPAILSAVRKAKVQPLPYLFACVLIANAASFVLPISNPANLVVFQTGLPPLKQWLVFFGLPSIASIAATYFVLRLLFRRDLQATMENGNPSAPLRSESKLMLAGLAAMVAVLLTASAFRQDLGLPTCLAALAVTTLLALRTRQNPLPLLREISWSTLALVAALFIMVRAVESVGALQLTQGWLAAAQRLTPAAGALLTGFAVAIANNLVNNLPLGFLAGSTLQAAHTRGFLAHVVLIGVDLGPNFSVTGSLATILWLLAIRKEGFHVGFFSFLKIGAIAMPAALLLSLCSLIALQTLFCSF